jgi:succinate dehydrogenase / fumarate reductase flavoprotein subunit
MLKVKGLIPELREEFWENITVPGRAGEFNQILERAGRVADFLEFAELFIEDALSRQESCGCHFREAFQTEDHEAQRDDEACGHVAAWDFNGVGKEPTLHKEPLVPEYVAFTERSYK